MSNSLFVTTYAHEYGADTWVSKSFGEAEARLADTLLDYLHEVSDETAREMCEAAATGDFGMVISAYFSNRENEGYEIDEFDLDVDTGADIEFIKARGAELLTGLPQKAPDDDGGADDDE